MSIPLYAVVKGVEVGMQYGLLAMGLVIIYRCTRVLNFAHGQLGVTSSVLLVHLIVDEHVPYGVALPIVFLVAAAIGAGSELMLRRLKDRPRMLVMVATIGLAIVLLLIGALPFVRPKRQFVAYPLPFHLSFTLGGTVFGPGEVFTFVCAPAVAVAVAVYFSVSKTGLRLRATAENPESARLAGVPVKRVTMLAWVIAALLSAATAIMAAPGQGTAFTQALGPELLLRALTAALLAAMTSLPIAFGAGIGIGVIEQVLTQNWIATPNRVSLVMFGLILVALVLRVGRLRRVTATDERSDWRLAVSTSRSLDPLRRTVGRSGIAIAVVFGLVLPMLLSQSHALLMSRVLVFALIAVSLTILAGWSGQLSLGHVAFVAVGFVVYTRLADNMSVVLLFFVAGAISALVAVVIGIPALRVPGLYLAVSTLGFALVMYSAVLTAGCFNVGFRVCPGLPNPEMTYNQRPHLLGLSLTNERTVTYVMLAILCLVLVVAVAWRDHGLARLLLAVRGNEQAAAAMGVRPIRAKLTAFAVSGFLAGVAGVCYGLVNERLSTEAFNAPQSIQVVAMIVVGGLGSLSGAVLGAVYLIGFPAIFGSTQTVQFLTSGIGLLGFLLFLPGGLGTVLSSAADAVTGVVRRTRLGRAPRGPALAADELAEPVGAGR
jgi:ABC-type branched-subunit amino acid transport system permease subunit